jgi:hypothetical protein
MRAATAPWRRQRKKREARPNEIGDAARMTPIEQHDWRGIAADLDSRGWAVLPGLLDRDTCGRAVDLYDREAIFRKQVIMQRHGYGQGEYRYFAYPLPPLVEQLRTALYPRLAPIANGWQARLGSTTRFPAEHDDFVERCHAAGQLRPTPLLLRYAAGDYNCLHQDLYGEHVFPLQAAVLLSEPGRDFEGGEFILTEQRPRMQSRAEVVPLGLGDAVIFAVAHRPRTGTRGDHRVTMRHGVATIRSGRRHTLGVIFHDAA